MKNNLPQKLACALSFGLLVSPTHAQSADISATAAILKQDNDIAAEVIQQLNFGPVNMPNGARSGAKCRYQISASETATNNLMWKADELDASGNVLTDTLPTPSRCGWGTSDRQTATYPQAAIGVYCVESLNVRTRASYKSAGLTGIKFEDSDDFIKIAAKDASAKMINYTAGTLLIAQCPANSSGTGYMTLHVGGQLTVDETASPDGSAIQVGTVTLDFEY